MIADPTIDDIELRPAVAADASPLAALALQVWLDTYALDGVSTDYADYVLAEFTAPAMRRLIDDGRHLVHVAAREGRLLAVGIVALGRGRDAAGSDDPRQAELERLYVQSRGCNAGLGARLLRAVETAAATRGITTLWLKAWIGNPRALHFYAREGYADVGTAWSELRGARYENRVFARGLGPA